MKRIIILTLALLASVGIVRTVYAQSTSSTFTWSFQGANQVMLGAGTQVNANLVVPTGKSATGVDLVLEYDPTALTVTPSFPTSPIFAQNNTASETVSANLARIYLRSTNINVVQGFTGTSTYASLAITTKKAGNTNVTVRCTSGATNDTNIVEQYTGEDIVTCPVAGFSISVLAPTPSPSPTPLPPTPTPTPTPVPATPTPTPSPTPATSGPRYYWSLPTLSTMYVGQTSQVTLGIDSVGKQIVGADVVLPYPATLINLEGAEATPKIFDSTSITKPAGGILKVTSTNTNAVNYFVGTGSYVTFTITAVAPGTVTLQPSCTTGSGSDSNLVERTTANDVITCPLPSLTLTIISPTASPAATTTIPVCLNITRDIASPKLGDQVRFTCGAISGATSYQFRYRMLERNMSGTLAAISAGANISQPLTISSAGTYDVECSACIGSACSPFVAW